MAVLRADKNFALRMNDLRGSFAPTGVSYSMQTETSYKVSFASGYALISGQNFDVETLKGLNQGAKVYVNGKFAFEASGMSFPHTFGELFTFNRMSLYLNVLNNPKNQVIGSNKNDYLKGHGGNDTLSGGKGDDTLATSGGRDVLIGGSGKDKFLLTQGSDAFKKLNTIKDFNVSEDRICLSEYMVDVDHKGALLASHFSLGSSATDASHRIIYNAANGYLYYDPDGSGPAQQKALFKLSLGLDLTHSSIYIV